MKIPKRRANFVWLGIAMDSGPFRCDEVPDFSLLISVLRN